MTMLCELFIRNLAIIDNLHVSFRRGLNILTGETGAGKSIIIDAVNLVMGGRASADLIRTGEEEATVEAVFDLTGQSALLEKLASMGVDIDGELLVKRVVQRSGKNRVFIGGSLSTVTILSELAQGLINIYGQHESQTLLKPENHLNLLDGYAGLFPLRDEFAAVFDEYRSVRAELARLSEGEREAARRIDLLSFQAEEISAAALVPGEEEELTRERQLLVHAEKLYRTSQGAFDALYGSEQAILDRLSAVKAELAVITGIDASLQPLLEVISSSSLQLEDAALSLRDYAGRIEVEPQRLQEVDDRLDLLQRLRKKYAPTVEEILAYREEVERELHGLLHREESRGGLEKRLEELVQRLAEQGEVLSARRREAASGLSQAMERELHDLAMKNALFQMSFDRLAEAKSSGMDRAEFLFSPNPGESPKPLARIASGGELSRLMLALKQIHPESDVPTLVFDEVDTGIGGATSARVGEKLKRVAREQQVLCITHLAQVAAFADHHYKVEKRVDAGRTVTSLAALSDEERVEEMARMLGGATITATTLDHAREMIEAGKLGA